MDKSQFTFGPFVLDARRKLLMKQDTPVPLGQRGVALLEALLAAGGRVVTKADLMDVAWPAQQVEESNLSVQIASLRKCLGPRHDGLEWITTVPRVGYRILAFDRRSDDIPDQAVGATYARPTIAVLPFQNLSGDPEQEYFSDGVTEDILTDLAKVSGLSVIARNAVFAYKGQIADSQELRGRLKVTNILEGSVRKSGNRVRISAQLTDTVKGTHIWADRYDRELTDVFAIQDEITKIIVEQLSIWLLPQEKRAIETAPTRNLDAYDYYLQGRYFYHLHTMQHVLIARRMFLKAAEIDPTYARAFAGLADAGSFLYAVHHPDVTIEEVLAAGQRALALAPDLAEAHAAYALGLVRAGRSLESVTAFEQAIKLNPNLFEAHYHYSEALYDLAAWEKAAASHERALEISPDDYRCLLMLAQMYDILGRRTESENMARAGIRSAERALALHPDVPLAATLGAGALAKLGELERALEWTARALTIDPDGALTQYNAACNYVLLLEVDKALILLERWIAEAHMATKKWLLTDSDFDGIRDHPRFKALITQID